jgi:NTP pyrophosphatase (non-canonical NTP hydrolase)
VSRKADGRDDDPRGKRAAALGLRGGERPDLDAIQAGVNIWARRFRPSPEAAADPMADALSIAEEAGEVCRAVLKRAHGKRPGTDWTAEVRLEAADVVISLLSLAANEGWSLADAVVERWDEVSHRVVVRGSDG